MEFDSPKNLLKKEGGVLRALVEGSGEKENLVASVESVWERDPVAVNEVCWKCEGLFWSLEQVFRLGEYCQRPVSLYDGLAADASNNRRFSFWMGAVWLGGDSTQSRAAKYLGCFKLVAKFQPVNLLSQY